MDRKVWKEWTVQDYIDQLEPELEKIQANRDVQDPITTREGMRHWCIHNQPGYKHEIPEVIDYLCEKYGIEVKR